MYSSEKILQEIICLLSLNGGRMNLLKLMKELYLIDRKSIQERDSSVSGDVFVSMPHGPVLSQTLNDLNNIPHNAWAEYLYKVESPYFPDILVKKSIEFDRLSSKDMEYITSISQTFKDYDEFQLEEYTHKLPEWVNPNGSSRKITFYSVMRALGKTDEEIAEAKAEYEQINHLAELQ